MANIPPSTPLRKKNLPKAENWPNLPGDYLPLLTELSRRKVTLWPYAADKTICEPDVAVRLGVAPYELGFLVDDHDGGSPQQVAELLEDVRACYDAWPSATSGHLHRWIYCGKRVERGLWRLSYRFDSSCGELRFTAPTIVYDPARLLALLRGRLWKVDFAGLMSHFEIDGRPIDEPREKIMKGSHDTLVRYAFSTALRGGDLDNVRAVALKAGIKLNAIEQTIGRAEVAAEKRQKTAWDAVQSVSLPPSSKKVLLKRRAILAAVYVYQLVGAIDAASDEEVSTAGHATLCSFANQFEPMCLKTFRIHLRALIDAGVIEHLGYVELGYVQGAFKRRLCRLRVAQL